MVVKENDSSEVVTSALDVSDLRKLTSSKALDAYPAWSPDGTLIAFYSDREVRPAHGFHLYIMDSDGSDERSLVSSAISTRQPPAWSPDGSRIAFVAFQTDFVGSGERVDDMSPGISSTPSGRTGRI